MDISFIFGKILPLLHIVDGTNGSLFFFPLEMTDTRARPSAISKTGPGFPDPSIIMFYCISRPMFSYLQDYHYKVMQLVR